MRVSATSTRSPRLAAALGLAVRPDGEWLLVRGADADAVLRGVRDAAVASGAGLRELRAGRADARGRADRSDRSEQRRASGRHRVHHATRGRAAGRLAAIWSLARWSALRALGARRGWKAKLIPITLTLLAFAPALIVLGLRAIFGSGSVSRIVASAARTRDYVSTIAIVVLVFAS